MISLPNDWRAREYQQPLFQHMFSDGGFPYEKRAMPVWHRRGGKDSCMINMLAMATQMRVGTYWHMLPTLNQGRKVIWNGVDGNSRRIVNQAFPNELVESTNENDMVVKLKNGSFYQVVGSDNYDALVGTNPVGVVGSEWALADPDAWKFMRPILAENGGFAAFITTPRGKNHAYEMYKMAQASEHWFTSLKTVRDTFREDGTPVITEEMIEREREEGVAEEVIQQEYFCSWEGINQGSIYGRYLQRYELTNQIPFPEDFLPEFPVYTAWDLGRRDATAVWFFQIILGEIHVIDYEEFLGMYVEDALDELKKKPYAYGMASLPHDAKAKTFGSRYSVQEQFVLNKFETYIVRLHSKADGINAGRALIKDVYFNIGNKNVRKGLERLNGYQYEWDPKLKVFKSEPLHDHNSHGADAFRTMAMARHIVTAATKNRNSTRPRGLVARALNLATLFREREEQRSNLNRRV